MSDLKSLQPWLDLSAHGMRLCIVDIPSGGRKLYLQGGSKNAFAAIRLGFRQLPEGGQWIRDDLTFKAGDFRREFPQLRIVSMASDEIYRQARVSAREEASAAEVQARSAAPAAPAGRPATSSNRVDQMRRAPADVSIAQTRYIGVNFEGNQVWQDIQQRYIRRPGEQVMLSESDRDEPGLFLRIRDEPDIDRCAEGLVREIAGGKRATVADLKRYATAGHGEDIGPTDLRLRQFQEAVEAALVRELARTANAPDAASYDLAQQLYALQPILAARSSSSVLLQQFSTSLPLGIVSQFLLGSPEELDGKTVLEPTIGHGALVSGLAGSRVIGFDLDPARAARARMLGDDRDVSVFVGDAASVAFPAADFVISNPPFGQLESQVDFGELRVRRIDHLILLRALEARAPQGRMVAIIGADSAQEKNAGEIKGSSRHLFNWLADHYQVEAVAEMAGSLFSRQGAGYPTRLVVIGDRRDVPLKGTGPKAITSPLPLIKGYDELWPWAEKVVAARQSAALNQVTEAQDQERQLPARAVAPAPRPVLNNEWQVPYQPFSRVGEATSMVPRNLVAPLRTALQRVVDDHGDLDKWVADELGWSVEQLGQRLSAEQVDACALKFHAADRGRGMIEADQTGMGKGRVLGASIVRAHRRGLPTIFLTEKPNLISDLVRDLRDLGVLDLFKPFVLNSGVAIRDTVSGEVLIPPSTPAMIEAALRAMELPDGVNLVFGTYSQFAQRDGRKGSWLRAVAEGAHLVKDESHVAAGESNIATVIADASSIAAETTDSSATYAKGAKNMAAYGKLFPRDMDISTLPEILAEGGETLQEVLSAMLAEDGVLIRREHDLSQLQFRAVVDERRLERNRELCDAAAPILSAMAYLGGDVKKIVATANGKNKKLLENIPEDDRKGARMQVSSMEFGSRLYGLNRLFMLAIKVDMAVEETLAALHRGEKPFIVVENTMETLLKESLGEVFDPNDDDIVAPVRLEFRDLLRRTLDRLMVVVERTGYGQVSRRRLDDEGSLRAYAHIADLINDFPDLPVSPLDTIRERVEQEGYRCDELSGRSLQMVAGEVVVRPKEDRNLIIARFNSGQSDALISTRTGSTGISLHSDPRFADIRQRNLIEVQIANNVAERMQFWGRVNRKNQVCPPIITTLASGLPAEARLLAMQNAKLRQLSANTTSNRSNAAEDGTIPDILNEVGEVVCRRLLLARPDIAEKLLIEVPEDGGEETGMSDLPFVNRLMGRLMLLPVAQQEEVYDEVVSEYRAVLEDYEAKGINPFKTRELDGVWTVVASRIFEGVEGAESVFQRPVYLTEIEGHRETSPLRSGAVQRLMESGSERLAKSAGTDFGDAAIYKAVDTINKRTRALLELALPERYATVEDAMAAAGENSVKTRYQQLDRVVKLLEQLRIGGFIKVTDEEGEARGGVVTYVDVPEGGAEHLPGRWEISFLLPGDEKPRKMSLFALVRDEAFVLSQEDASLRPFDEVAGGKVTIRRTALTGNLFRAVGFTASMQVDGKRVGSPAIWRDDHGTAHRAVLLPKQFLAIDLLPVSMPSRMAAALVREFHDARVYSDSKLTRDGLVAFNRGETVRIEVPGTISGGGKFYADEAVMRVTGDWAGNRERMAVDVPRDKVEEAFQALARAGATFYAQSAYREWSTAWSTEQLRPAADAPQPAERRLRASK